MYKFTSQLFSEASDGRAWESCDCERNVKEERVFHLDSFPVRGDLESPAAAGGSDGNSSGDSGSDGSGSSIGSNSGGGDGNGSGDSGSGSGGISGKRSSGSGSKGSGFLSASFKFIGPAYPTESEPALRAAVQVLQSNRGMKLHRRAIAWCTAALLLPCARTTAAAAAAAAATAAAGAAVF